VLEKIGEVAYRLDLPATSRIHPVLHVSQLKKQVRPDVVISDDISTILMDPMQKMLPEKVIRTRLIQCGARIMKQALVQWDGLPASLATWEAKADVKLD
jgi:hypothetical protein